MEKRINLQSQLKLDAECTNHTDDKLSSQYINDRIVQQVSLLHLSILNAHIQMDYDDINSPSFSFIEGSLDNFEINISENILLVKELPSHMVPKIKLTLPYNKIYANVSVENQHGHVSLPNLKCEIIRIDNINGQNELKNINSGLTIFKNVDGYINVVKILSDEMYLENVSGEIFINQVICKKSSAKTKTGSIVVKKSTSPIDEIESRSGDIFWDSKLISDNDSSKGMN